MAVALVTAMLLPWCAALGQVVSDDEFPITPDSILLRRDSVVVAVVPADSARMDSLTLLSDSLVTAASKVKVRKPFVPDPIRSLWLSLVFPGAGQIYNRKYWKLPIIYGGFLGCTYALSWNNQMLSDYSQAYLDIMDNDPTTDSYNKFLHLGVEITESNEQRYKDLFKSRKDKYRRWRDLSFFVMLGVYAFSVIDAYVDAELSEFDISKDLSLKISPVVIPNHSGGNLLQAQSLGISCSLNF
jgi:hypothetical protein